MSVPVITVGQMREWEKASWADGRREKDVIARVGQIVASRAKQLTEPGALIVILAGKGHNGDDARQAKPHLEDWEVCLVDVTDPKMAHEKILSLLRRRPQLIIDGLFGIGLNRPLAPDWISLINAINESGLTILSVDVPSGLNAETCYPEGSAFRAALTLTLGAPKIGMLQPQAWPFVGRLEVALEIVMVE
jgi:NAD(P)H-hydrate repair Nnr-like enzyme with NAD(P)H-hydrate epimerase domain